MTTFSQNHGAFVTESNKKLNADMVLAQLDNMTDSDLQDFRDMNDVSGLVDWLQGVWIDLRCPAVSYEVIGAKCWKIRQGRYESCFDLNPYSKKRKLFWGFKKTHYLAAALGEDVALWANRGDEIIWKWARMERMMQPSNHLALNYSSTFSCTFNLKNIDMSSLPMKSFAKSHTPVTSATNTPDVSVYESGGSSAEISSEDESSSDSEESGISVIAANTSGICSKPATINSRELASAPG